LAINHHKAAVDTMSEQNPDAILRRKVALARQGQDAWQNVEFSAGAGD